MSKVRFITADSNAYIRAISEHLNVKFISNWQKLKNIDKPMIIWNPYGWVRSKRAKQRSEWKWQIYTYFREHNKPVYVLERGYLPNCLYLDKNGVLFNSSSYHEKNWNHPLTLEQDQKIANYIVKMVQNDISLEVQQSPRLSHKDFFKKINLNPEGKKVVFVPMQKWNDTVTVVWCGWCKTMMNFQKIIRKLGQNNPNIIFLVKDHPLERIYPMGTSKNVIIVNNLHYKDCIEYSDVTLTINSSVGMQAMMWNKPAIMVGDACFQFDGINYKAHSEAEIIDLIYNAQLPDMEKAKRYLYYLKYNFYTDCIMSGHNPQRIKRIVFEHPITNEKVIIKI